MPNQRRRRQRTVRGAPDRRRPPARPAGRYSEPTADSARSRRRGRTAVGVAIILAAAGTAAGLILTSQGGPTGENAISRSGSVRLPGAGGVLPITNPPAEYSVTYREDDFAGKPVVTTTVVVSVVRPFESVYQTLAGAPPGSRVESTYVNSFGLYSLSSAGSGGTVTAVMPGSASEDFRLDATLPDLLARGVLVPRERRRVLGTVCQVYRTYQPLGSSKLAAPTKDNFADECIDARGLLLEEVWVSNGKALSRKVAVTVQTAPSFPAGTFAISTKSLLPISNGGAKLVPLTPGSRPATNFWTAPQPPPGFQEKGVYLYAQGSPTAAVSVPSVFSTVDVYTDGPNVIAVVQGNTADLPTPIGSDPLGRPVTAGQLPHPQALPGPFGNTLQSQLDANRYLKVVGTVPMQQLVSFAATLVPEPPGKVTLVPLGTG